MIWDKLLSEEVFFIAEIGKGFIQTKDERSVDEYLANAKELIDEAKASGADAVKFQTHVVTDEQMDVDVVSPHFKGSDRYGWVKRNTESTPDIFWKELKSYSEKLGVQFFSTPMSRGAAQKLDAIGVDLWKVGSGDILDFVLLDYLRNSGRPIIVSSGMSTLVELDRAMAFLLAKNDKVALLHCISKYPCPADEVHLNAIPFFQDRYDVPIGFSDHSIGYATVLGAVGLGASIVEKHFSLSRDLWGSDHKVSMLPNEFAAMTKRVRDGDLDVGEVDRYYGSVVADELPDSKSEFRQYFRKSLVAAHDIPEGAVIDSSMLYAMRPQVHIDGVPSEDYEKVIGQKVKKAVKQYEPLRGDNLWQQIVDPSKNSVRVGE